MTQAVHNTPSPVGDRRRTTAAIGFITFAATAFITADILNPQYHPASEMVSRYVNGTAGWLISAGILAIAAASGFLTWQLRGARIGRWLLAIWTLGLTVAGLFPADPPGQWSQPSSSEMIHGMAALPAFAVLPIAALLLTKTLSAHWPDGRKALLTATVAVLLSTTTMTVLLIDVMSARNLSFGALPTLVGAAERLTLAADLAWLVLAITAVAAGRRRERAGRA